MKRSLLVRLMILVRRNLVPRRLMVWSLVLLSVMVLSWCGMAFAEEGAAEVVPQPVLQLQPEELELKKGRSAGVKASVVNMPENTRAGKFEWVSSDPDVAVYQDGKVRGVGGGAAALTCSVELTNGIRLSAECEVKVTVPVSGISAGTKEITAMAGDVFIPDIHVLPEDASNPNIKITTSDEEILSVGEDGQVRALAEGKAYLTAASEDDINKKIRLTVTVTRRIGKSDGELTFLGVPWESDFETCIRLLKEKGFIAQEAQCRCSFTDFAWHWPENDLLFSRLSSWRTLPVSFSDRQEGAKRTSMNPQKTIGGFLPQTATLVFLNGMDEEERIDPETTRLIGVYFGFDNRHEDGTVIFRELLGRLEEQYGEFNRYISRDIPRYYQELYEQIKPVMSEAKEFRTQEPGIDVYLGEYVICTMYGKGNTGIMLNMDTNGIVTLFYGRTDAPEMIIKLRDAMVDDAPILEDAGV